MHYYLNVSTRENDQSTSIGAITEEYRKHVKRYSDVTFCAYQKLLVWLFTSTWTVHSLHLYCREVMVCVQNVVDKAELNNYRSIPNSSTLSKLIEERVASTLQKTLNVLIYSRLGWLPTCMYQRVWMKIEIKHCDGNVNTANCHRVRNWRMTNE